MSSPHTVRSFDDDLLSLRRKISVLGGLAEAQFASAVHALIQGDIDLARRLIGYDEQIDNLNLSVKEEAVQLIARRQPMAIDLREAVSTIRIAAELERIGDLAKNIAKRRVALQQAQFRAELVPHVSRMAAVAREQINRVLDAYDHFDSHAALAVRDRDTELDELHTSFFRDSLELLESHCDGPASLAHLLFCAKNIELVGDHVSNISASVYFIATGFSAPEKRGKHDAISSINSSDSSGVLNEWMRLRRNMK